MNPNNPSRGEVHRIIQTAAKVVGWMKPDPTTLQEIGDSTEDPFRVLIATVLSQRTRDPVTEKASSRLFARYPNVKTLAKANSRTISQLIRPVGFYKTKARQVKKISKILLDKYGGEVPDSIEALLELPQVGRKTANCVLVYGFGRPAIPVDTHVHRVSNRIGIVRTESPEETEAALVRIVDRKYWLDLNEVFVRFGQTVCKPIGPHCPECPLSGDCAYYRSSRVRGR